MEENSPVYQILFIPMYILENNNNRSSSSHSNEGKGSSFSYHLLNSNYRVGTFTCIGSVNSHSVKTYTLRFRTLKKPFRDDAIWGSLLLEDGFLRALN